MSPLQEGLLKLQRRTLLLVLIALLLAGCERQTPAPTATPTLPGPTRPAPPTERPVITSLTPRPTVAPAPESPTPPPTPVDAGTLVLWHSWSGADADALAQILAGYRERRPRVQVQTLFVSYDDLPSAYPAAVEAGGGPDLFLAPMWWLQDMVEAQVLLPLEGLLTPEDLAGYHLAALDSLVVSGRLYGLPTNYELVSLYVNQALIAAEDLPRTTEEMIELAQADPTQGAGLYTNFYHLYWGIPAYGGALFDEQGRVILDQTPGTAQFLDWLRRAAQTQGIFASLDYGMLIDRFKKGEYAFFVDGPWSRAELQQALGSDLGMALLPAGPVGPARPWLAADGVFLNPNRDREQQQLALDLAR
ncbi:MAG: extracellular solute-binding protein, partial [Caldilineae bacterium]